MVVPAAGCGARAAQNGNKILAPLLGRPLLSWTLEALAGARLEEAGCQVVEWVLCARQEEFDAIRAAVPAALQPSLRLVEGGHTRQQSVFHGVKNSRGDLVLVHDAARPCVGGELVQRVVVAARANGAAIAALPVSDTVKRAPRDGSFIAETLDRSTIWLAQTPQVFRRSLFLEALERAAREEFDGTDCASIVERWGHQVALVEGEATNLKVTYPADLERAAAIMETRGT